MLIEFRDKDGLRQSIHADDLRGLSETKGRAVITRTDGGFMQIADSYDTAKHLYEQATGWRIPSAHCENRTPKEETPEPTKKELAQKAVWLVVELRRMSKKFAPVELWKDKHNEAKQICKQLNIPWEGSYSDILDKLEECFCRIEQPAPPANIPLAGVALMLVKGLNGGGRRGTYEAAKAACDALGVDWAGPYDDVIIRLKKYIEEA